MSVVQRVGDWLEARAGWRGFGVRAREALCVPAPAGVGWSATIGAALLALVLLEAATGIALALHYQPTPESAHGSVARIMDEVRFGWIVRSLHVWGAHALVGLSLVQMLRVFLAGAHKRPRELTWILGAGVLFVVLAFAFTGTILPWTGDGYWGAVVRLDKVRTAPLAGGAAAALLGGGDTVGASTLSRWYALHVIVLPAAMAVTLALHLSQVRRHGLTPPGGAEDPAPPVEGPPPAHLLRQLPVAAAATAALLTLAALWPQELPPRAGPAAPPGIRPEWYFLCLYQYLKYWPGTVLGIPGETVGMTVFCAALAAVALLPLLDRSPERRLRRRPLSVALALAAVLLWGTLTVLGAVSDRTVHAFGRPWTFDTWGRLR